MDSVESSPTDVFRVFIDDGSLSIAMIWHIGVGFKIAHFISGKYVIVQSSTIFVLPRILCRDS